ncbi:hypothetical protein [Bacteroides acidifaciens]|uniref:hypothetical protein n=1 Tax=Bacteroides acidifaciens TaxID=85831 RepID=UPI003014228F
MSNPNFDIKPGDRYIVTDKDNYPASNSCHCYELTSEKDKDIVLNAWNDERMIVDKTFEKTWFNEKKSDIEKLRKDIKEHLSSYKSDIEKLREDIKEHLSSYASKGYVDKVMNNMGENIILNILWCSSCNEAGTYSDILLDTIPEDCSPVWCYFFPKQTYQYTEKERLTSALSYISFITLHFRFIHYLSYTYIFRAVHLRCTLFTGTLSPTPSLFFPLYLL